MRLDLVPGHKKEKSKLPILASSVELESRLGLCSTGMAKIRPLALWSTGRHGEETTTIAHAQPNAQPRLHIAPDKVLVQDGVGQVIRAIE